MSAFSQEDVIVVGGGLFGHLIGRGLVNAGRKVLIIDNEEPNAGSPPAACLIRKEWCGKLPEGVYEAGLNFLMQNFTVQEKELIQFGNTKNPRVVAHWVDPRQMLSLFVKRGTVSGIPFKPEPDGSWMVSGDSNHGTFVYRCKLLIVAAGIWSQELMPWYNMNLKGKAGVAFLFRDVIQPGFAVPWAPYKQIVGFHRGDGYWISDGSAILAENWRPERTQQCYERCCTEKLRKISEQSPGAVKTLYGIRPYAPEFCICKQVRPNLWVASGARKNGTLLGAWCAQKIAKEMS